MTATPEELLENFKNQQQTLGQELQKLTEELNTKREIFVKLQGAIEGLELLNPNTEGEEGTTDAATDTPPEASTEAVDTALS